MEIGREQVWCWVRGRLRVDRGVGFGAGVVVGLGLGFGVGLGVGFGVGAGVGFGAVLVFAAATFAEKY